jgi:hypothetical protein
MTVQDETEVPMSPEWPPPDEPGAAIRQVDAPDQAPGVTGGLDLPAAL